MEFRGPDLDREYWYMPEKRYAEDQRHRALFHNVVVIALAYVVSPFLSLGVFHHVLQDSFTTVKDRGVEWFYPFTRLTKRGMFDSSGVAQSPDPKERVYFYQEDPPGLVKLADPDLQEPNLQPVPWRRVYGFAQNSHLLDRGFLFGSIAIMVLWLLDPVNSQAVSSSVASPAKGLGRPRFERLARISSPCYLRFSEIRLDCNSRSRIQLILIGKRWNMFEGRTSK